VGEALPYLSDSTEWKVQLSKNFELEYQPVPQEPVVKSYTMTAQTDSEVPPQEAADRMYLRIVSAKVQPQKMNELRKIYAEEIIPELRATRGCRYAYLTEGIEETNEAISVTIWSSKENADAYDQGGGFAKLLDKVRHTFSEVYQWKMALEREFSGEVVSSGDPDVEGYSIVAGKRFR
jgi:quinol monooxygenase YgiN